jgi:uncharacterized protein YndB with AHSA1/START domain
MCDDPAQWRFGEARLPQRYLERRGKERVMTRLTYSTTIQAPGDVVWRTMLEDETYRQWTSAFHEGSYAVTDWKPGSKALFLGPDGSGMVSRVAEHRPNEFLSLEHLGVVKEGVEDIEGEGVSKWAGAREDYTLTEERGSVTLRVDMDTTEEHKKFFEEVWPKALANLKGLSERRAAVRA